jgi:Zn finger protein HypA/HybF involved in hydrogenase expression
MGGLEVIDCENCGELFDPVASRWLCPHCHWKSTCCEGEPQ